MNTSANASAVPAQATAAPAENAGVQLRILSGCHQGASLAIAADELLRVGSDDDCDVLLSDCGLAAGESVQVGWQQGRWSVQMPVSGPGAEPSSQALGTQALLGQVHATVCAEHAPWPALTPDLALPKARDAHALAAPEEPAGMQPTEVEQVHASAATAPEPKPARPRRTRQWATGALALALLSVGWVVWRNAPEAGQAQAWQASPLAEAVVLPQENDKAVKAASLAIALVDPALRMRVEANAEGGVTVSGWVDSFEQFDRLAQALSSQRPLPRLAVRTAAEVLDALSDAGSAHGVNLQFSLMGSGKVQAKGLVTAPAMQQLVLAQLRARAPDGIEIVDGLRVASLQGPAVKRWLQAQGLVATKAEWDGEQLVLGVDITDAQRAPLERLLAAPQTPLTGVPFVLQARQMKAAAVARRSNPADSGLPFVIRSVVGGVAPYVVLADGAKLQPGGRHAGWRLVAIAPDHLVFDGPQRLEVSR